MRALEELDLALGGDCLGRADHAVVDELLVELERGGQLLDRPGDLVGLRVDHVLAGHLRRHQRDDEERVQAIRLERVVVGAELLVEHRRGGDQVVPGLRDRQAGAVELGLVEEHHPAGGRDVQPVELAVDGPGGKVGLAPLGEVDGAGELVEVGEAVALLAEERQPRPVDLQDVGLGGAGHLGGELLLEARPAGELGLDGVAIFGAADLQRLLGGGVAAVAAPPGHAQVGGVGRAGGEGDQRGEGGGRAKHWEFLLGCQFEGLKRPVRAGFCVEDVDAVLDGLEGDLGAAAGGSVVLLARHDGDEDVALDLDVQVDLVPHELRGDDRADEGLRIIGSRELQVLRRIPKVTAPGSTASRRARSSPKRTAWRPMRMTGAPSRSRVAAIRFISGADEAGDEGVLRPLVERGGSATCTMRPSFITQIRSPMVIASVWSWVT